MSPLRWRRLGKVYCPDGSLGWARSHAMVPTPVLVGEDVIRVYVTMCDENQLGRPGFVELDAANPLKVIRSTAAPLLDLGRAGSFDESGVMATSVVAVDDRTWFMYYVGFELCKKIRYRLLTGVAISDDAGLTFRRYKEVPILERSQSEQFFRCAPQVLHERRGEGWVFRMWYVAGSSWIDVNGKSVPVYSMKYMESVDGLLWPESGVSTLELTDPDEHGFGRPWVVHHGADEYELFYSIRKKSCAAYRLGYARSVNGMQWQRQDDQLGLDVVADEWDSETQMYSSVITVQGRTYCFYNGNNFGAAGFGCAELVNELRTGVTSNPK